MPGFNIGALDTTQSTNITESLRAHRWLIEKLGPVSVSRLIFAKTLVLPGFSVEEEIALGAATKYKFAKMVNWDDVSLSFYDVVEFGTATPSETTGASPFINSIFSQLLFWQRKIYTPEGGIGSPNTYKESSIFTLTDGNGNKISPIFHLHGSWPKAITHSPLSYESSDIKLVDVVLSYDFTTYHNVATREQ